MDWLTILVMAIGLAMDCFAIALSEGLHRHTWSGRIWLMALLFGVFQGGMPLLSFAVGQWFTEFLSRFAPWIALGILGTIGGKMIYSAWHHPYEPNDETTSSESLNAGRLVLLAIATSIDALATGLLFVPCPDYIWAGISAFAAVAALFTVTGYLIGMYWGKFLPFSPDWIAGTLLVALGIKICVSAYI